MLFIVESAAVFWANKGIKKREQESGLHKKFAPLRATDGFLALSKPAHRPIS